ncbi:uncharacterized protein LOC108707911 isoform X2 [Xenopus laevis]|uniref:Uncharacterized protein LOC108707911 isoform X2 n=1 Tax=Xenopus laevis TaxID=8355 RepID=A0A8J0UGB0_XENLA|nr:uncharacterized protein LOC108707911 isoform X2 [Xenopus laevis]
MAATEGQGDREAMSMQSIEKRFSGWKCSKTALSDQKVADLLKEFTELNRKEQENGLDNVRQKNNPKEKCSVYPSPGNILHTGRQLPRTPGPGILPLLPSQIFEAKDPVGEVFEDLYQSINKNGIKGADNTVPCGRQLQRTPVLSGKLALIQQTSILSEEQLQGGIQTGTLPGDSNTEGQLKDLLNIKGSEKDPINKANSCLLETQCPEPILSDTATNEKIANCNAKMNASNVERGDGRAEVNRRISELPVQGLNKIRVSGVLKKMPGYECRSEDLEFLEQLANLEKIKVLKGELSGLRKGLTTANRNMELEMAKKEKIEEDIHKMKKSFENTVQLGREFLSRTQEDPTAVKDLAAEDILKNLKLMSIQQVHQKVKVQLLAAQKDLTKRREMNKSLKTTVEVKIRKKLLLLKARLKKHRSILQKQRSVFKRREHKSAA